MPGSLSSLLLPQAANNRHGLVFNPQTAYLSKSDVQDIFHVGVPFAADNAWKSASGGVAQDKQSATLAAIGEGVERYCAAIKQVPLKTAGSISAKKLLDSNDWTLFSQKQRERVDFSFSNLYSESCLYTDVYKLGTNEEFWAPHPLVVLRDDYETGIPTSSGLAAGPDGISATLRALQELIERDALMATWLHSLPGRAVKLDAKNQKSVDHLGGEVYAFDLTPDYSPFPVVAVAGGIPQRGVWRFSLGVACRETFSAALQKAFLEWSQGVFFAGVYPKYVDLGNLTKPSDVKSFDDHAIYYTLNPDQWRKLPLLTNRHKIYKPKTLGKARKPRQALDLAVNRLDKADIAVYYRDLSTIDAVQAGVRVVRVLSPDMIPINAHHEWPFLGGNASDIKMRYAWAQSKTNFPNPSPHPLG